MKIYTKTGDDGSTGLIGSVRVSKASLRVSAYGEVDELNAALGMAMCELEIPRLKEWLRRIQNELFVVGADLATPKATEKTLHVEMSAIEKLEAEMDLVSESLPELKAFILPGGTKAAAALHHARCVCRRSEREVVSLSKNEDINELVGQYLNRLADWLFVMARYCNNEAGIQDIEWHADR